ncbi:uncharacterized protein FOMMEDRAFT_157740 [Fomitiporia mediterranea MF3/22]|uniref:uncharacterized protein n=1 Tax=Fomitiporia mediterranea (strain MF3/22) TaxID=694068 RepID=UPI00044082D6|nr:uncharacterized protein FOMMEDRAFT_157740 [Fomitiporia mediterranea MF3/22]EJD02517.1 hypothetical protein FOMMEDRAFT_157740 [Fomitiporia mediterranea MF3/22]
MSPGYADHPTLSHDARQRRGFFYLPGPVPLCSFVPVAKKGASLAREATFGEKRTPPGHLAPTGCW